MPAKQRYAEQIQHLARKIHAISDNADGLNSGLLTVLSSDLEAALEALRSFTPDRLRAIADSLERDGFHTKGTIADMRKMADLSAKVLGEPEPPKPELKPCPFCGSRVQSVHSATGSWVQCDSCCTKSGYYSDRQSAVDHWNHRSESNA